jgi:hypothetical protein
MSSNNTAKEQSLEQKCLAAARMRDGKSRCNNTSTRTNEIIAASLVKLESKGLLRDTRAIRARLAAAGGIEILAAGGNTGKQVFPVMQATAYTQIMRRADVSRALGMDVKTVTRYKILTAQCGIVSDNLYMKQKGRSLKNGSLQSL